MGTRDSDLQSKCGPAEPPGSRVSFSPSPGGGGDPSVEFCHRWGADEVPSLLETETQLLVNDGPTEVRNLRWTDPRELQMASGPAQNHDACPPPFP